eukprot:TRINITY_DN2326_c0_g1_i1.p1 TRINITY_DN2326_c0_g1~~TRINITY_DN2326_c0_g1_i1.p1  ORF type:complete len:164 (+),score=20.22 TRINITY_DN2326_c0_g1_i1:72-563(+)
MLGTRLFERKISNTSPLSSLLTVFSKSQPMSNPGKVPKPSRSSSQRLWRFFQNFKYEREWFSADGSQWALEFTANVDTSASGVRGPNGQPLWLKGVDLVKLDDKGHIVELEVVMRPLNSISALRAEMGERIPKKFRELGIPFPAPSNKSQQSSGDHNKSKAKL